jgi:REP element-mobilizing transposase RayT
MTMIHNRHSLRLKEYDYTQPGPYFVTTVTHGRENLFGNVLDGQIQLNEFGQIVADAWQWLGRQYPYLELSAAVVMPNHFHGIILIGDNSCRDGSRHAVTDGKIKPLGQLFGAFKTISAKRINLLRGAPGLPVWQRDFYERVIRDEDELARIHQYIIDNPANWQEDDEYA